MNGYKELRKTGAVGFAHAYLDQCDKESKPDKEIDIEVYNKLVQLDSKLGTNASRQLRSCLSNTTRWDLIKVLFTLINTDLNLSRLLTLKKWRDTKN